MINLIKNELYKIFHKKSIIIVFIIMALYMVLTNFIIYKVDIDETRSYRFGSKEYITICMQNTQDKEEYASCNALNDTYNRMGNYYNDTSSWQSSVYMNNYYKEAINYYNEKIIYNNEDQESKNKMDLIASKIDAGDWKYFVNEDIKDKTKELDRLKIEKNNASKSRLADINKQIFVLEEEIKLDEYRIKENLPKNVDYLNNAIDNIDNSLYELYEYNNNLINGDIRDYKYAVSTYYENKYILDTKQNIDDYKSLRAFLFDIFSNYDFIMLVFIIMVAGSIVSEEFNKGTIKSLLVMPYKRTTILMAKYISVIISVLIGVLYVYLIELVVGGLFFGFDSLSIPFVTYNFDTNAIETLNVFKYSLILTGTRLPRLILFATLAFSLSTIICNTAFAIAITFCGTAGESVLKLLSSNYKYKFLDYFVTNNWDFNEFLFGGTIKSGVSLTHAIIVCLVYLLIMLVVSFIVFKKKDIKNI